MKIIAAFLLYRPWADERHGNPPQGNQELLVVKDKVGRPQLSLRQVHGV